MSICLFGALNKLNTEVMLRSFEQRIAPSTVKRWAQGIRKTTESIDNTAEKARAQNRLLRARVEKRFKNEGINIDSRPLFDSNVGDARQEEIGLAVFTFDFLEKVDRSIREDKVFANCRHIEASKRGMIALSAVPSGGRWKNRPRHVLSKTQQDNWLPEPIEAGSATAAASKLCDWLSELWHENQVLFAWLIEKWIYASERDRGRMRMDDETDFNQAVLLARSGAIRVEINNIDLASRKIAFKKLKNPQMRLRCLDESGNRLVRDTGAVRWVMSHIAARWLARN